MKAGHLSSLARTPSQTRSCQQIKKKERTVETTAMNRPLQDTTAIFLQPNKCQTVTGSSGYTVQPINPY